MRVGFPAGRVTTPKPRSRGRRSTSQACSSSSATASRSPAADPISRPLQAQAVPQICPPPIEIASDFIAISGNLVVHDS
jgi:hypothetical protein